MAASASCWKAAEVVGRHVNEVAVTSLGEEGRAEMRRELAEKVRWRGEVAVARKEPVMREIDAQQSVRVAAYRVLGNAQRRAEHAGLRQVIARILGQREYEVAGRADLR